MDRNLIRYEREVYTTLDWFGNLGGLSEGFKLFFGTIVALLNYNYYENYMVSNLFMQSENLEETQTGDAKGKRSCCFSNKKKKAGNEKLKSKNT